MAIPADEAAQLPAPKELTLNALAVTATASAGQDTGIVDGTQWYTFEADGDNVYIIFGKTATLTDPNDATLGSGAGVAWCIFANTTQDFIINGNTRFFKAKCIATETSTLRYRRSA